MQSEVVFGFAVVKIDHGQHWLALLKIIPVSGIL